MGGTRGYRNHPQLERFRATTSPSTSIGDYLHHVADEADRRGYRFDRSKLGPRPAATRLEVTTGQVAFEREHLKRKLDTRDAERSSALPEAHAIQSHPMFTIVDGPISEWERI